MKIIISHASGKPMYEQVKDGIRQAVYNGEFKGDELLPGMRQLAADLNVSMITTKRAYADLERDGLLYTISGKGTYVKSDTLDAAITNHADTLLGELKTLAAELKKLKSPKERLIAAVDEIYTEGNVLDGK
ncbi:MAG: GntR family transcriptional regulator [Oscillospiraceae bacterium]|nr:GntR family transcriptional regulator [Oscillospiraceae bacterium]